MNQREFWSLIGSLAGLALLMASRPFGHSDWLGVVGVLVYLLAHPVIYRNGPIDWRDLTLTAPLVLAVVAAGVGVSHYGLMPSWLTTSLVCAVLLAWVVIELRHQRRLRAAADSA
jgi:hypothetical protein